MRDKKFVRDDKMYAVRVNDPEFIGLSAKHMSSKLLHKEYRGPGDTIEAAAFRSQTKYGVDAEIILQGWRRDIKEMKASRWLRLFYAYCSSGLAKADELYEAERSRHDDSSALVRLADLVAGQKATETKE